MLFLLLLLHRVTTSTRKSCNFDGAHLTSTQSSRTHTSRHNNSRKLGTRAQNFLKQEDEVYFIWVRSLFIYVVFIVPTLCIMASNSSPNQELSSRKRKRGSTPDSNSGEMKLRRVIVSSCQILVLIIKLYVRHSSVYCEFIHKVLEKFYFCHK